VFLEIEQEGEWTVLKTYEAVLEPDGHLRFMEDIATPIFESCRVLVTFTSPSQSLDAALCDVVLSEAALAEDWSRSEEDAAWVHLQRDK
jgi:hypothetical protein